MKTFTNYFLFAILFLLIKPIMSKEREPNELGKIFVLTYHKIGDFDSNFTRSRKGFVEDLQTLKREGFIPIQTNDFSNANIKIPKGKKPVLITFDDSSISQFEVDENGQIKSNCAVGMMEEFKKKNPDFPLTAIFFVTPGSKSPNDLFGQIRFTKMKTEFLLNNGYEIGNHTLWHANLNQFRDRIQEQIAGCQREINKFLPDFRIYAMATPYGSFPPERYNHLLIEGKYKGHSYKNKIIFDYSNRLSYSPFDINFNIYRVRRIHGFDKNIKKIVQELNSPTSDAYISDGLEDTITIPQSEVKNLNTEWKKKFKVKVY
ncbi:MAG: polysaccharide deacetylase family protein [Leptospiraceae bacterium]|nr:polysaccharide deacetylase family protein [Leptospiraceae bacterium]MCK6380270.1 polysaccharide deacetylase family protein [Leptospiraceae bacterium]NUM41095.1 polysaccharide deacetylase family protein [Leptospiraceae bacterium]